MQRIILASDSAARKRLLKEIGLSFISLPPKVKEDKVNRDFITLVKENALKKASSVAKKFKKGIVIACDTLTVVGKTIIGKPKTINEAKRFLRLAFNKPISLYTGVVVIDIKNKKKLLGYEKTKVWLAYMSNKEIGQYFKRVSPLDKAGAFDIQGVGSFFIRRIEGCFYNVVGLPLAKLYQMLKKLDIDLWAYIK